MADVYTDTSSDVYARLLAAGYDRFLEYQLRSQAIFRQLVDKHPVDPTNVGPSVTMNIIKQYASTATTPLTETLDVAATAPPVPDQVTVTVDEYGRAQASTLRLQQLAYAKPDPAVAHVLGLDMVDTLDELVRTVLNAATHQLDTESGTLKSDAGVTVGNIVAADVFSSKLARTAVTRLRGRNAPARDAGQNYIALAHPDVVNDVLADAGWLAPHQYQDTANVYNAEAGKYLGARYIMTPRATQANVGASSAAVYNTYVLGSQALVEATIADAHVVISPQTDHLRRFYGMGWLFHGGWAIFRDECIEIVKSQSSVSGL